MRYPNFAALAADSTWFRNGYSIYDSTTKAVPLILDGMWPRPGSTPDRAGHPRSLFDMFRRRGYRMVASEEASALCPPRMCRGGRAQKPAIPPLLNRGRPQRFNRWVRTIKDGRPTFWMKHLLLPHIPYVYLPSGARTRPGGRDPLPGMTTVPGFHDEYLTRHNEQRYLLQLGYTDRLLGRLAPAPEGPGHLRRHSDRGGGRPRLPVALRCRDAPPRARRHRPRAVAGPVHRQATGPAPRPGERRVRAHARCAVDDRGRARRAARLPRRRALGLQPRRAAHPPGHVPHAGLRRRGHGARQALAGAAAAGRAAARCASSAPATSARSTPGSARTARCSGATSPASCAPPAAAGAERSRAGSCSRTCAGAPASCRPRSPAMLEGGPGMSARPGGGRERPDRRGGALVPARRRRERELRLHGSRERAARRAQHGRGVRGGRRQAPAPAGPP